MSFDQPMALPSVPHVTPAVPPVSYVLIVALQRPRGPLEVVDELLGRR